MDLPALTNLDGTPLDDRPWNPLRGHGWLLLLFFVALAADVTMHAAFVFMSGGAPSAWLLLTAVSWIDGLCALLTPVAVVIRTPDAWASRRTLLVGALLLAAGQLLSAANEGLFGLNWWLLPGGVSPDLFRALLDGVSWAGHLVFVGAPLLIGLALARARSNPVPRQRWLFIGGALVVVAAVTLSTLSAFSAVPVTAVLIGLGTLAGLYQMWATLAGWFAGELPRRPWALASAGVVFSILASLLYLVQPMPGDPLLVAFAVTATVGTILTLLAFADGLGARSDREGGIS